MNKIYSYIIVFFLMFASTGFAQDGKQSSSNIEGLTFYPNPVSNGKIYITSKLGLEKEVIIYDVLGKKIFQATLTSRELNISNIAAGVYIIKIRENDATATRKLIVK